MISELKWEMIDNGLLAEEWQAQTGDTSYVMVAACERRDGQGAHWCVTAWEFDVLDCDPDLVRMAMALNGDPSDVATSVFEMQADLLPAIYLPNLAVCSAVIGTVLDGDFDIISELRKRSCEFICTAYKVSERYECGEYVEREVPETRETHYLLDDDEALRFIGEFTYDKITEGEWEMVRNPDGPDTVIYWHIELRYAETGKVWDWNDGMPNAIYEAMQEAERNYASFLEGNYVGPWHIYELTDAERVLDYEY